MNHTSVTQSVQPHIELNTFHRQNGRRYTIGETNSVSGQGSHGVSDVFGSALWLVDYCLYIASQNITRIHLHQGTSYRYASWLPVQVNGTGPYVKPPYYGNAFVARFLGTSGTQVQNIDLGSDYYSVYTAYESGRLARLAVLNLHEWNPDNSTTTSSSSSSSRPTTSFKFALPGFKSALVQSLTAPGALYNTSITMAGISYDYHLNQGKGVQVGESGEEIRPAKGVFTIDVADSQAAIVSFAK
jgi:hypothetical protein